MMSPPSSPSGKKPLSYVASLRLEQVRADSIDVTALLDKRKAYNLSPVKRTASRGGSKKGKRGPGGLGGGDSNAVVDEDISKSDDGAFSAPVAPQISATPDTGDNRNNSTTVNSVVNDNSNYNVDKSGDKTSANILQTSSSLAQTIAVQNLHPYSKPRTLPPDLLEYYNSLAPVQLADFRSRVTTTARAISLAIHSQAVGSKAAMNTKGVFHPNANAHRAHTQMLVRLQRALNDDAIAGVVLKEMRSDEGRVLEGDEVRDLEKRFGKLFANTVFGEIVGEHREKEVKNEETIGERFGMLSPLGETVNVPVNNAVTGNTVKNISNRNIMNLHDYKDLQRQNQPEEGSGLSPLERSLMAREAKETMRKDDKFAEFRHVKSMEARGGVRRGESVPLTYNVDGAYSGLLSGGGGGSGMDAKARAALNGDNLIAGDVSDKLWFPSEIGGRKPSYGERYSTSRGFHNEFLEDGDNEHFPKKDNEGKDGAGEEKKGEEEGSEGEEGEEGEEGSWESDEVDEVDDSNNVPSGFPESGADPSPSSPPRRDFNRRRSSMKIRRRLGSGGGGADPPPPPPRGAASPALTLQDRLEGVWKSLSTPMIKRLNFLAKFSTIEHSSKLPRAVELWGEAGELLPVRDKAIRIQVDLDRERVGPEDIRRDIDCEYLKRVGCFAEFSPSFFFEERLEEGRLTDEELLEVSKGFDARVRGEEDDYLKDMRRWIRERVGDLTDEAHRLQKIMLQEIDEVLIISSVPVKEGSKVDGEHEVKVDNR